MKNLTNIFKDNFRRKNQNIKLPAVIAAIILGYADIDWRPQGKIFLNSTILGNLEKYFLKWIGLSSLKSLFPLDSLLLATLAFDTDVRNRSILDDFFL